MLDLVNPAFTEARSVRNLTTRCAVRSDSPSINDRSELQWDAVTRYNRPAGGVLQCSISRRPKSPIVLDGVATVDLNDEAAAHLLDSALEQNDISIRRTCQEELARAAHGVFVWQQSGR